MAANSSSWDDYNNKLNEAYANAQNEEEQNSIIERAMNRSQYDQFIEAQNFANMQRKAYNDEQQQYQDDYTSKVAELRRREMKLMNKLRIWRCKLMIISV